MGAAPFGAVCRIAHHTEREREREQRQEDMSRRPGRRKESSKRGHVPPPAVVTPGRAGSTGRTAGAPPCRPLLDVNGGSGLVLAAVVAVCVGQNMCELTEPNKNTTRRRGRTGAGDCAGPSVGAGGWLTRWRVGCGTGRCGGGGNGRSWLHDWLHTSCWGQWLGSRSYVPLGCVGCIVSCGVVG
jgi:hypothetical protein